MKLRLLTTAALLLSGLTVPAIAQTPEQTQPNQSVDLLEVCAQGRAATLPIPFSDLSPDDWAFEAVMKLYYCGAYNGSLPPEQVRPFLQPRPTQSLSFSPAPDYSKFNQASIEAVNSVFKRRAI
jgi:hypothetical protein